MGQKQNATSKRSSVQQFTYNINLPYQMTRARSEVVRNLLHFMVGCRTRRLNQV